MLISRYGVAMTLKRFFFAVLFAISPAIFAHTAHAAGDLTRQDPIEIVVSLGTKDGQHVFVPNKLTFETGKLYKLILVNPSADKHYFSSPGLVRKIFTRKVQVFIGDKRTAEIKGIINEIEVFPGGKSEWWFVPVATGVIKDLHCHVKTKDGPTHEDMGMTGEITIK